jgi:hypothetical protein
VSYEILGNNGGYWSCNQRGWAAYLKVATAFGWAPDGAFFKDDEAGFGPHLSGSYLGNDRQLVTDEDAHAFGAALRLALTTADLELPMTVDQKDALADFREQRACELRWAADSHKRCVADFYNLNAMRALADVVSDGGFMIA